MKKIFKILIATILFLSFSLQAAMDPKLKVILESSGYGVVGGTLLGTATLAFGGEGRNIAKGASLGLYAGLLLGTYVVSTYEMKKRGWGQEKEDSDYYPETDGTYGEGQSSVFRLEEEIYAQKEKPVKETGVSFGFPIFHYRF
jgi:hypothetical protein